jgi:hypothetical protein
MEGLDFGACSRFWPHSMITRSGAGTHRVHIKKWMARLFRALQGSTGTIVRFLARRLERASQPGSSTDRRLAGERQRRAWRARYRRILRALPVGRGVPLLDVLRGVPPRPCPGPL